MIEDPFRGLSTYVGLTGIQLTAWSPDSATGRLEITDDHQQPYGVVHGGVCCTLAETLASTGAAFWAMEQGLAGAVGVSNTTDFLRPMLRGVLLGEATPIMRGRTQQLWQVDITREADGKQIALSHVRLQNVDKIEF